MFWHAYADFACTSGKITGDSVFCLKDNCDLSRPEIVHKDILSEIELKLPFFIKPAAFRINSGWGLKGSISNFRLDTIFDL